MQQFIPFEDDWDTLENLRPEALIPYRVGLQLSGDPMAGDHRLAPPTPMDRPPGRCFEQLVRARVSGH